MQDASEQLEPLLAERMDVRHLVWRYALVCRRSRLHRRLARQAPFRALLPASELLGGSASKLRGCLAWLGGLRLASLQLIGRPLGPAGLAQLAALMAELAPQHCALIPALRVLAQGPAAEFDAGGCRRQAGAGGGVRPPGVALRLGPSERRRSCHATPPLQWC